MRNQRIVPALSFGLLTPAFDFFAALLGYGRRFKRAVLNAAALQGEETLLDIGCGTGELLLLAKRTYPGLRAIGIDADERIIALAHQKLRRAGVHVELHRVGAQALPLPDASVDVVVSSLVFHHLPTAVKHQVIAEVARVLSPTGRFLLADFGKMQAPIWRLLYWFITLLHLPEARTMRDNIEGRLPRFLEAAGFRTADVAPRQRGVEFLLAIKAPAGDV